MNFRPASADGFVACALISLVVFAGATDSAKAQGVAGTIPANASAKTYGRGWECDRGFHKIDGACAVVALPENAYLTDSTYGSGWKCKHGYKQNKDASIMELMKTITVKKRKIEKRLYHVPTV